MQKTILFGIIAIAAVAGGIGIAFATMSMNGVPATESPSPQSLDSDVRVIQHDMGETEITGTPERVVLLDTHSFSMMMELGIEPVGVQYWQEDEWAGEGKIFWEAYYPGITEKWPNVVNTGNEPNLEVITQLEPDLIIAQSWGSEIYDDLSEIAPTILYKDGPPQGSDLDNLEAAERITMGIADALNRHDEGVAMIERFHAHLEENAAQLEDAGIAGKKFIFAQTWTEDDNSVFIRVWAGPSKPSLILEEMGIVNAAPMPEQVLEDGRWDGVGLEGLSTLDGPDVHFMYMPSGDDDAIADQWIDKNPVWENLSFVKEGRVYKLDPYLYMYGGPQKDAEFADAVVKLLTAKQQQSDETRTIAHAMGETEITGTPERVIALEWIYAEDLLALGVQPVGVADIEDFNRWVNMKGLELDESVVEVGHRWEPNLETMAQLEPDLIIGHVSNNAAMYDQLSEIAPTLIFNPDTSQEGSLGQLEEMRQTFMTIDDVMGKHDRGIEVLERMDRTIADAAQQVSDSRKLEDRFVLALAFTWEDATYIRIYANNALAVEVMEQMGMENAWDIDRAFWGYTDATLEDLATVEDADFFHIAQEDDNVFETTFKDNPVWENLQFVKEERVYHLMGVITPTGGPITVEVLAEAVAETVLSKQ